MKRPRRTFTDEFKNQMVQLYLNGKSRADLIREYDLTPSSLDKWINQHQKSGSFKEKDNRETEPWREKIEETLENLLNFAVGRKN